MNKSPETPSILIVDDTPQNLRLLTDMLKDHDYRIRPIPNGSMALRAAELEPPNLILLDITMPEMDGYEVCRRLKANPKLADIPVIFLSALNDPQDKVYAFAAGGQDYITKPFQVEEVLARVKTHLRIAALQKELLRHNRELEILVAEKVKEISNAQIATIIALARLAESRDDETGRHIERVQIFCRILAEELALQPKYASEITTEFVTNLFYAAPLHDIGKVGIPDAILLKPGKLTSEEFETMKRHTIIGWETLRAVTERYPQNAFLTMGAIIARSHHERWDGNGYPDKLKGEEIPLAGRIMAVADVYEALRAKRCYKEPFSHEKSCAILKECAGTQFDPDIVAAFETCEARFSRIYEQLLE